MATFRKPIIGFGAKPDTTGECFFEPYGVLATNEASHGDRIICRFGANNAAEPTVKHGFYGGFVVPKNYASTAVLVVVWTSTLTTGAVVWDFDYRTVGGDDTTSLDQATAEESVTVTDTAPGAAHRRMSPTISMTDGNFTADDEVEFFFARDGASASDTLAGSALLFSLAFQYND